MVDIVQSVEQLYVAQYVPCSSQGILLSLLCALLLRGLSPEGGRLFYKGARPVPRSAGLRTEAIHRGAEVPSAAKRPMVAEPFGAICKPVRALPV